MSDNSFNGSFQACNSSNILGNFNAKLCLSLLQLCNPGPVSITHGFADAVCQLISQLPLHPLGLRIHLGQLTKNKVNNRVKILYIKIGVNECEGEEG